MRANAYPAKGWTPEKRRQAYRRFGELIIQVAHELNVPANELLTYALKGEVPPEGRDQGVEDTKVPGQLALPAPAVPKLTEPAPQRRTGPVKHHWSEAEVARLEELAGKVPALKIAEDLQLSVNAIYSKAGERKISLSGAPNVHGHLVWKDEVVAKLRSLAGTMPVHELAKALGATELAVERAASRFKVSLRLTPEARPPRQKPDSYWNEERVAELRRLAEVEKLSGRHIAQRWGKSSGSISGACFRFRIQLQAQSGAKAKPIKAPLEKRLVTRPIRPAPKLVSRPLKAPIVRTTVSEASPTEWVRLQHPDGRWLRIDGLGWVADRSASYLAQRKYLPGARAKFPLARECIAVPERPWRPRDIEHAMALR